MLIFLNSLFLKFDKSKFWLLKYFYFIEINKLDELWIYLFLLIKKIKQTFFFQKTNEILLGNYKRLKNNIGYAKLYITLAVISGVQRVKGVFSALLLHVVIS